MSTNIADLNTANMQELSSNIQQEIDDGKANEYLSADRLNNLQQVICAEKQCLVVPAPQKLPNLDSLDL